MCSHSLSLCSSPSFLLPIHQLNTRAAIERRSHKFHSGICSTVSSCCAVWSKKKDYSSRGAMRLRGSGGVIFTRPPRKSWGAWLWDGREIEDLSSSAPSFLGSYQSITSGNQSTAAPSTSPLQKDWRDRSSLFSVLSTRGFMKRLKGPLLPPLLTDVTALFRFIYNKKPRFSKGPPSSGLGNVEQSIYWTYYIGGILRGT